MTNAHLTQRFLPPQKPFELPAAHPRPAFYDCGCCGAWHHESFFGDCRDDSARFFAEDLDARYGAFGWDEAEMYPE